MKHILLIFIFLGLIFQSSFAQRRNNDYNSENFREFSSKPFFFGLSLGYNQTNFKIFRSGPFLTSDSIYRVNSLAGKGFNVGIISNLKIGDFVDFRLLPTFSFTERNISYTTSNGGILERKAESVFIEIPFHVRYKTAPYKDMRAFILGGIKYSFDVSNKNRTKDLNNIVKIAPIDYSIEVGGGIQFFFPFFIFSPEIKFSHGLNNTLIQDNTKQTSNVLDRLLSRTWVISLNFEG